jgi:hypothetical protein
MPVTTRIYDPSAPAGDLPQLARRALDYLVGFKLSPVLWRKLPGAKSAGRVQSVALRLVCDRELDIEKFKPREYWSLEAFLQTKAGAPFSARLIGADGKKINRLDIGTGAEAESFKAGLENATFSVTPWFGFVLTSDRWTTLPSEDRVADAVTAGIFWSPNT